VLVDIVEVVTSCIEVTVVDTVVVVVVSSCTNGAIDSVVVGDTVVVVGDVFVVVVVIIASVVVNIGETEGGWSDVVSIDCVDNTFICDVVVVVADKLHGHVGDGAPHGQLFGDMPTGTRIYGITL
jgi:hypothetical protein